MRIPAVQARAIYRGAKTTIRVPVDPRLTATPLRPARRHGGRPFTAAAGDILTLHADTQIVHTKILAADRSPLGHLTDQQAQAEGYPTAAEFELAWTNRHDHAWLDRQAQYLRDQDIPEAEIQQACDALAIIRYADHWTPREAWTLILEPFHDMPFLLPGLPDEPEAIPVTKLHPRWQMRTAKRMRQAQSAEAQRQAAKALARHVKQLAIQGDPLADHIRDLIDQRMDKAA
jgi:hypothetical protein